MEQIKRNETRTRMESNKMLDMEIIHRGARAKAMRREKEKMERKNIKTRIWNMDKIGCEEISKEEADRIEGKL